MGSASVYLPYSYVILLVQLCRTFGAPLLHLWYQNALLFWYCQYLPIFHIEVLAKTN